MNPNANFYETLGIATSASPDDVRTAYRRLARKYHPDRYEGRGDSADIMARINQAYAVLSDPHARSEYNALLRPTRPAPMGPSAAEIAARDKKPWVMLWIITSLIVLAVGWVAVRTLVPTPAPPPIPTMSKAAPVDNGVIDKSATQRN